MIIDKLSVEFSLLMPLLHLPLETTNRFIHPRHFFTILLSLYFFLSWILDSLQVSLCFVFRYYLKLLQILLKRIDFISFHFKKKYKQQRKQGKAAVTKLVNLDLVFKQICFTAGVRFFVVYFQWAIEFSYHISGIQFLTGDISHHSQRTR